jgi:hypothetical protein
MADNVHKEVPESIGESDNEIGGQLITRLRDAHLHGRDDGLLAFGNRLDSPVAIFTSAMVGWEVDVLKKDPATGNEGRYRIGTFNSSTSVVLTDLGGGAITWTILEDNAWWRFASLRVESALEFHDPPTATDPVGKLWVGSEPEVVTYGDRILAPGAHLFEQLGDPDTGRGYLTQTQREDAEVIEALQIYSALDKLRRALLTAYATEDELDRIGRVVNVARPRGIGDEIYRNLLQVMPYLPRCGVYAYELVLAALYPAKTPAEIRAMIWEDLVDYPNAVFLLLPENEPTTVVEGRTIMTDVAEVTSNSATSITIPNTPITIESVVPAVVEQALDMSVLPSADSPAWTYVNEGVVEGSAFSVASGTLLHTCAASANGGRYKRASSNISEDFCEVHAWWRPVALVTVAGYPWHLMIHAGGAEVALNWSDSAVMLGQLNGTVVAGPIAKTLTSGWHHFVLRRRGSLVWAFLDNQDLWGPVDASLFAADATLEVGFGYKNNASVNDWTVSWDNVSFYSAAERNYWNLNRADGSLSAGSDVLTSALGLFVSADTGKLVRLRGSDNKNNGLWRATFTSATQLTLSGVVRGEAIVDGAGTAATVTLLDPWFRRVDVNKIITIAGSGLGNNGDVTVLEVIDSRTARVNKTGSFTAEDGLNWSFKADFANESSVPWELVAVGTNVTTALTLRDALPATTMDVVVTYTSVLSAQILRNEFVANLGSGSSPPNIYYPAYFADVSESIRRLLDDISAAGVIPYYQRID